MRKLTAYGMTTTVPMGLTLDQPAHVIQCRAVVAAHNQKEAAALLGVTLHQFRSMSFEPDPHSVPAMQATAFPGVPLYAPLDAPRDATWVRVDGTPAAFTPTQKETHRA